MSSSDDGVQTRAMENVRRVTQRHLPYDKRIQSYDEFADTFDEDLSSLGYELPTILGEILTNLFQGDKTNIRVLDVAAGTGLVGVKLHERGFTNIDALEPSTGMLDKAREKKVYTNLCNVPISEDPLDIAADSYNAVTSVGGFGGGMAPFGSVREMLRLVKPGGYVIILARRYFGNYDEYIRDFIPLVDKLEKEQKLEKVEMTTCDFIQGTEGERIVFKVL